MSIISMILVVIVAFLAGIEGVVDEFQFHQPLVACTLIGLVTGNLEAGIVLGGSLQHPYGEHMLQKEYEQPLLRINLLQQEG